MAKSIVILSCNIFDDGDYKIINKHLYLFNSCKCFVVFENSMLFRRLFRGAFRDNMMYQSYQKKLSCPEPLSFGRGPSLSAGEGCPFG